MVRFLPAREIVIDLFGWQIRWYGVLYLVAFSVVWYLLPRLARYRGLELSREDWLYMMTWGIAGVLVGGRMGFVSLYEPEYFWARPGDILALWQGGMSWHGGLAGVGLALWLVSRQLKIEFWRLADVVVVPAALGLAVGRLGNVINGELFIGPLAQFLAVAINVLIFGILFWILKAGEINKQGKCAGGHIVAQFLMLAGLARFGMEYLRLQQHESILGLTRGQLFSLIIVAAGGLLMIWRRRLEKRRE